MMHPLGVFILFIPYFKGILINTVPSVWGYYDRILTQLTFLSMTIGKKDYHWLIIDKNTREM